MVEDWKLSAESNVKFIDKKDSCFDFEIIRPLAIAPLTNKWLYKFIFQNSRVENNC